MAQPNGAEQKLEIETATENGPSPDPAPATTAAPLEDKERDIEANLILTGNGHQQAGDEADVPKRIQRRGGRWGETLSTTHADIIFIICSLTTGLCDAAVYASFGCFISMQTGNTIFVGLGASGIPTSNPYGWLKSLTSICGFLTGSFTFSRIMRAAGARKRITLTLCFVTQSLLLLIAAAIIQANVIPHGLDNQPTSGPLFLELIPLAMLAFQFSGQLASSRGMGFNELPTIVLTSVYFDVASDPELTRGITKNVKRNRRMASAAAILVGGIAAGWLCRSKAEMQGALWISGFIKACIAAAWAMWPA
jgi:uncharacterized membrane protein YoaK (UPF0700 family)